MKKVIFISALAIAAAVSCTKSDIVDTKFNEAISFENYLGRDAMTKSTVIETANLESVKVFGYYHGEGNWKSGGSLLWDGGLVLNTPAGVVTQPSGDDVRYWANESDVYSFLAYAPVGHASLVEAEGFDTANPVLTYTVNNDFTNADVLVAEPQTDRTKGDGKVALVFKHKLARLAIKSNVTKGVFDFRIKSVKLTGAFNTTGTIALVEPTEWDATPTEGTIYTFQDDTKVNEALLEGVNAIGSKGYLMMIPVDADDHNAKLEVKYTTYDSNADQESRVYTLTYDVKTDFEMGKAYAIELGFKNDATAIEFSVKVDPTWGEEGEVTITPAN